MNTQSFQSLYLHFPFCETKCHYCDFYSLPEKKATLELKKGLIRGIQKEAEGFLNRLPQEGWETIFLGGGTPSRTDPSEMAQALEILFSTSPPTKKTEWTMEANPSSVDRQRMQSYRGLGINRISLGIQSLSNPHLKMMGRVHTHQEALQALEDIFSAELQNVSVDLLCGIPEQNLKELESALAILTSYPITHLSCYLLTLPKNHFMYSRLPSEETQYQHLMFLHEFMEAKGFRHYEISNFAKPGFEAKHNLAYWKRKPYLGLGPSAHSFDLKQRWRNVPSLELYIEKTSKKMSPIQFEETLDQNQIHLEKIMLGLRLDEGIPKEWILKTKSLEKAMESGLMENHPQDPEKIRLTSKGYPVCDEVLRMVS